MEHEHTTHSSFKIKTKKIRSEKTLPIAPSETSIKEEKSDKKIPKFLLNKSTKMLAPLEKEQEPLKPVKSAKVLPAPRSMKNIRI
jgi:hypothetical protein